MKHCTLLILIFSAFLTYGQKAKRIKEQRDTPTYKLIVPGEGNRPTAVLISEPRRGYCNGKDTGQLPFHVLWSSKKGDTVIMGYPDYKNQPLKKGTFKMK